MRHNMVKELRFEIFVAIRSLSSWMSFGSHCTRFHFLRKLLLMPLPFELSCFGTDARSSYLSSFLFKSSSRLWQAWRLAFSLSFCASPSFCNGALSRISSKNWERFWTLQARISV